MTTNRRDALLLRSVQLFLLAVCFLCGVQSVWAATPGIPLTKRNQHLFQQWDGDVYCYSRSKGAVAVPGKVVKGILPGAAQKRGDIFQSYALIRDQKIAVVRKSGKYLYRIVGIRFRYNEMIRKQAELCGYPNRVTVATEAVLKNAADPEASLIALNSLLLAGMKLYTDPVAFFLRAEEAMLAAFETKADFDALPTLLSVMEDFYNVEDLSVAEESATRNARNSVGRANEPGCSTLEDVVLYQVGSGQDTILHSLVSAVLLKKLAALDGTVEFRFWTNRDLYTTHSDEALCRQFIGPVSLPYVAPENNTKIAALPAKHRSVARAYQAAYNRCLTAYGVVAGDVQNYAGWLAAAQAYTPSSTAALGLSGLVSQDVISGRQVIVFTHGLGAKTAQAALAIVPVDDEGDQKSSVGVVAVAPSGAFASQGSLGAFTYHTLSQDLVSGLPGAPAANLENDLSQRPSLNPVYYRNAVDDLVLSYLYFSSSRTSLLASISSQSGALTNARAGAGQGFFQVTLRWDQAGDIDLHVRENVTGGNYVYYGSKQGVVGQLDRDDIPGTGPENYFTCSRSQVLPGTYQIWVNNFANSNSGVVSDITIRAGRTVKTFSKVMDSANGRGICLPVATVTYADGRFTIVDNLADSSVSCGP